MVSGVSWDTSFITNSLSELRMRPAVEPDMSTAREIRHCVNDEASDPGPSSLAVRASLFRSFSNRGEYGGDCVSSCGDGGISVHVARGARRGDLGV